MASYCLKLIEKIEEASGTSSYKFERPNGFEYKAGQCVVIKVPAPQGSLPFSVRTFTLSSAPSEREYIQVTMRDGVSSFKKYLQRVKVGDRVEVFSPSGRYVVSENKKVPLVMLAGGIGIAPFRSMIVELMNQSNLNDILLIYSNPSIDRVTFKNELDFFQKTLSSVVNKQGFRLNVVYTLTKEVPGGWGGEIGRLDIEMIKKYVNDVHRPVYYICGPPQMVSEISDTLCDSLNVDKEKVKCEKFSGY